MSDRQTICDCCGYEAETKEYRREDRTEGDPHYFCDICAGTFLSQCISYPRLYGGQHHLYSSIGWIANYLKEIIEKGQVAK